MPGNKCGEKALHRFLHCLQMQIVIRPTQFPAKTRHQGHLTIHAPSEWVHPVHNCNRHLSLANNTHAVNAATDILHQMPLTGRPSAGKYFYKALYAKTVYGKWRWCSEILASVHSRCAVFKPLDNPSPVVRHMYQVSIPPAPSASSKFQRS